MWKIKYTYYHIPILYSVSYCLSSKYYLSGDKPFSSVFAHFAFVEDILCIWPIIAHTHTHSVPVCNVYGKHSIDFSNFPCPCIVYINFVSRKKCKHDVILFCILLLWIEFARCSWKEIISHQTIVWSNPGAYDWSPSSQAVLYIIAVRLFADIVYLEHVLKYHPRLPSI